jgi:hypothetical protein
MTHRAATTRRRFNLATTRAGAQITQICTPESTMLVGSDLRHIGGNVRLSEPGGGDRA